MKTDCPATPANFTWTLVDTTTCSPIVGSFKVPIRLEDIAVYDDVQNKATSSALTTTPKPIGTFCAPGASIYSRPIFEADMTAPDAPPTGWTLTFD
ncbi:hypothetical protein AURDEDRAFT_173071 [Auricularia subglabra TFB-10046 SS5]|uniref:Uncharacterized protein n=1 Tax=Auricularia subglabra (strain TFB-10046 / SS5) TaxID=717982 RepID=J0D0Q6_AURST|nr:hypothetical protein AURDEDRAFT_173071 [Auricularia subglabra TFB-10046 SS5]